MALAALIIATEAAIGDGQALRATLPLLGRTVIEHQVRQATGAGATHLVVLVERMPADLTAAFDRLRRDGIAIDVARTIGDAADRFHPDERLLLIADGCVADRGMLELLAAQRPPTVMTVTDQPERSDHERIDAHARWAGLALLDGAAVRSTAAMLGDWDPQSTLLRRAVQAGAGQVDVTAAGPPRMAVRIEALEGLDRHLLRESRAPARRWPRRWVFALVDGPVAGWLARRAVDPHPIALAAALLAVAGMGIAVAGWRGTGLAAALLSGPAAAIAGRLARVRAGEIRRAATIERVRWGALALALVALAYPLGDAWLLAAVVTIAAQGATASALYGIAGLSAERGPPWIANPDALAWTIAPVAILFGWAAGLGAGLCYAAASFVGMQALFVAAARSDRDGAV